MIRATTLLATTSVTATRFDHPHEDVHLDPEREVAERWGIAFVEAGEFSVEANGRCIALRPGSIFLTRPDLEYRCRHQSETPDDICLAIGFAPAATREAEDSWITAGWVARRRPTPRLAMVHARLNDAVGLRDSFEMERWALASLSALEDDGAQRRPRGPYAVRPSDIEAVLAVCRSIDSAPEARRLIESRAGDLGMTGSRLTHLFRRYQGVSPHQYVVRRRLQRATEFLDEGLSVTESCYRAGFENLSHFVRRFRAALGTRPSMWRSLPLPERRRKVQAMLTPSR